MESVALDSSTIEKITVLIEKIVSEKIALFLVDVKSHAEPLNAISDRVWKKYVSPEHGNEFYGILYKKNCEFSRIFLNVPGFLNVFVGFSKFFDILHVCYDFFISMALERNRN